MDVSNAFLLSRNEDPEDKRVLFLVDVQNGAGLADLEVRRVRAAADLLCHTQIVIDEDLQSDELQLTLASQATLMKLLAKPMADGSVSQQALQQVETAKLACRKNITIALQNSVGSDDTTSLEDAGDAAEQRRWTVANLARAQHMERAESGHSASTWRNYLVKLSTNTVRWRHVPLTRDSGAVNCPRALGFLLQEVLSSEETAWSPFLTLSGRFQKTQDILSMDLSEFEPHLVPVHAAQATPHAPPAAAVRMLHDRLVAENIVSSHKRTADMPNAGAVLSTFQGHSSPTVPGTKEPGNLSREISTWKRRLGQGVLDEATAEALQHTVHKTVTTFGRVLAAEARRVCNEYIIQYKLCLSAAAEQPIGTVLPGVTTELLLDSFTAAARKESSRRLATLLGDTRHVRDMVEATVALNQEELNDCAKFELANLLEAIQAHMVASGQGLGESQVIHEVGQVDVSYSTCTPAAIRAPEEEPVQAVRMPTEEDPVQAKRMQAEEQQQLAKQAAAKMAQAHIKRAGAKLPPVALQLLGLAVPASISDNLQAVCSAAEKQVPWAASLLRQDLVRNVKKAAARKFAGFLKL